VLEEFGLARDGWSADSKYNPAATTTHRDRYYQALYAAVETAMARSDPLAGDGFWAWSGEARPAGSGWTGDPPHEPRGWYSVYDTDETTRQVVVQHAANVQRYAASTSDR
jgi:mannan endo-1,4-beta-mannosidase